MSNYALFYGFLIMSLPSPEGLLFCFSIISCHGPDFVSDNLQNSQYFDPLRGIFLKWWLLQAGFPPAGQSKTSFVCLKCLHIGHC